MKSLHKYLTNYAESETCIAQELLCDTRHKNSWQYCLVIPAYRESAAFFQRLATSLLRHQAVLLILVINQPDKFSSAHPSNTRLWQNLIYHSTEQSALGNLQLRSVDNTNSGVLLVDRFSPTRQIPEKQGVGLARKIGADIALALINNRYIVKPWIYTSDADAHLPGDYFSALSFTDDSNGTTQPAAVIYSFRHLCDSTAVGQATKLYEQRMLQYVDGLRKAGSPYSFQTIGSAIAVSAKHYAQVRGFPKRSGGEDFYLLNKLAKTGVIHNLPAPLITIEARQSDRVPFGTGPAINKLLLEESLDKAEIFYHPKIFAELKTWLDVMNLSQKVALKNLPLSIDMMEGLQAIGADKAIEAARKVSTSSQSYSKHMNTWFDGFKTLKLIHHLRDNAYPNVCLEKCTN